jgi:hypothetical protein
LDIDAQHRTLVTIFHAATEPFLPTHVLLAIEEFKEANMGKGILLWLLGVPIPVIILLWLFFGR